MNIGIEINRWVLCVCVIVAWIGLLSCVQIKAQLIDYRSLNTDHFLTNLYYIRVNTNSGGALSNWVYGIGHSGNGFIEKNLGIGTNATLYGITTSSNVIDSSNVKFWGAVGNGVANDYSAVTSAIAASKTVYFPPGIYLLSNRVELADNVALIGIGNATIKFTGDYGVTATQLRTNVSISGIKFLGTNQNSDASSGSAIWATNLSASQWIIENCKFYNVLCGVDMEAPTNITVMNCDFVACSLAGIRGVAANDFSVLNNHWNGSRIGVGNEQAGRIFCWAAAGDSGDGGDNWRICNNATYINSSETINCHASHSIISGNQIIGATNGISGTAIAVEPSSISGSWTTNGLYGAGFFCQVINNNISYCDTGIRWWYDPGNISMPPFHGMIQGNFISEISGDSGCGIVVKGLGETNTIIDINISGNSIFHLTGTGNCYGMDLIDVSDSMVYGNTIDSTPSAGMHVGGTLSNATHNLQVFGNSIIRPTTYGILVDPSATNCIIGCSFLFNTISFGTTTGRGIVASSGNKQCVYNFNTVIGDGTHVQDALLLAGQSLVADGNVALGCVNNVTYFSTYDISTVPVSFDQPLSVGIGSALLVNSVGTVTTTNTINAAAGFIVGAAVGMTTNINVLKAGGTTNQLQFTKGILTGVVPQ